MMEGLQVIREGGFVGYNDRLPPEFLKSGYLSDALNCFIVGGSIIKRNGYTVIGSAVGSYACQGMKGVRFANGTKEILAVWNGSIYKYTGSGSFTLVGSGSGVLSTSAYVDIVVANNAVYFFDGISTVCKYTVGGSISTVAAIPIGSFAMWFHNQLHVSGISGSPNKLKSSDLGNPENFSTGNYSDIDINPNDGDYITGLNTLKDELIIFKQNRTWAMSNFGSSTLTVANLGERLSGLGSVSHRGIVNTGNSLIYPSFYGKKLHFRALSRSVYGTLVDGGIVSNDIEVTLDGVNKSKLNMIAGVFDGKYLWYSVPNASSTTNNLVLTQDVNNKGWTRHTGINASAFDLFTISTTPTMYFGDAGSVGKAYSFDTSTSDNGTAIPFSITSRRYGGGVAEAKKKFKWIYITARETGNFDLTVDYAQDGFTYVNMGTINLSGSGSTFDNIILDTSRLGSTSIRKTSLYFIKSRQFYLDIKMYETSAASSVEIRNWEIGYYQKSPMEI